MTTIDLETLGGPESAPEAPDEGAAAKRIAGRSPTQIALERLRKDKVALFTGGVLLFLIVIAIFAPVITRLWHISTQPDITGLAINPLTALPAYGPPLNGFILSHPLGIDPTTGADNLATLLYGLRTDLAIAIIATIGTTVIGTVLGLVSGFSRGALDRIINFFTDTFLTFPFILGAMSIAPIVTSHFASDPGALTWAQIVSLIFVLIFFGWMGLTRLIRGYVISLREREFVQAAQVIGVPTRRILFKELLPNMVAPLVVSISMSIPAFVSIEAGLSYLGLGITGSPSLGEMIVLATHYYSSYPLYLYAPVAVLTILCITGNLLGDSVRDAFDPQTRR